MRTPILVAVTNLSPESSNVDSIVANTDELLSRAAQQVQAGAQYIEIGARSTSVHSPLLDDTIEEGRLIPALKCLKDSGYKVSVDTWSTKVALRSLDEGCDILNYLGTNATNDLRDSLRASDALLAINFMPHGDPYALRDVAEPSTVTMDHIMRYFGDFIDNIGVPLDRIIIDPNIGILHPKINRSIQAYVEYAMAIILRMDQLRDAFGCATMVDHSRRGSALIWGALLRELGPDYVRTHDPEIFRDLSQSQWGQTLTSVGYD